MEHVISKIRKLIALGTNAGATDGERDNAIRMAHGLLARHNLAIGDIEEVQEKRLEQSGDYQNKPWAAVTAQAIGKLFFCSCYSELKRANITGAGTKRKTYFVGKESNVTTAILMADYVIGAIGRERSKQKLSYSFCNGAANKIHARVEQIVASATMQEGELVESTRTDLALMSVYKSEEQENDAYIERTIGALRSRPSKARNTDAGAYRAGNEFGEGLSLNTQLTGQASPSAVLTLTVKETPDKWRHAE